MAETIAGKIGRLRFYKRSRRNRPIDETNALDLVSLILIRLFFEIAFGSSRQQKSALEEAVINIFESGTKPNKMIKKTRKNKRPESKKKIIGKLGPIWID